MNAPNNGAQRAGGDKSMAVDQHEEIRRRAYQLWEEEGRPEGAELRHWLQACDELAGDDEHEMMQELIDKDDRDDAALLQGAGESGDLDTPPVTPPDSSAAEGTAIPDVEITTGATPARQKIKRTEGP
jgi:hypothetical protein